MNQHASHYAGTLPIRARFNAKLPTYFFWYGLLVLLATVVGILLIPFWVLGVGQWYARRYIGTLECELAERYLRFQKGVLYQVEKTIPLDNIQDLTFKEGPLLRYFGLSVLEIETASQGTQGPTEMKLIGIENAAAFRDRVITQRERITGRDEEAPRLPSGDDGTLGSARVEQLLVEIRDALRAMAAARKASE